MISGDMENLKALDSNLSSSPALSSRPTYLDFMVRHHNHPSPPTTLHHDLPAKTYSTCAPMQLNITGEKHTVSLAHSP